MSYAGVTELCPNCHKEEDTKIVDQCKHCGYVYEDRGEWYIKFIVSIIVVLLIYVGYTLLDWFFYSDTKSLLDILREQFAWVKTLRIK